jgi:hypothetical protein
MNRSGLILALVAALVWLLSGCGGWDTTTIIRRPATTETTDSPPESPSPSGPRGELTSASVGPVRQGMTTAQVRSLFGAPDRTKHFSGCPLYSGSTATLDWIWDLTDGGITLDFDAASGRLSSYRTTSPGFPTTIGNRVGDSFQSLHESWGTGLHPLSLGVPSTAQSGEWFVRDTPKAELLFSIRGGKVTTITGGYVPICE